MSAANGHGSISDAIRRLDEGEAKHQSLDEFVRAEASHVRGELKDIKAALDIILSAMALDERDDNG